MSTSKTTSAQQKQAQQLQSLTSANANKRTRAPRAIAPAQPVAQVPTSTVDIAAQVAAMKVAFPQLGAQDLLTMVLQVNGQAPVAQVPAQAAPAPAPAPKAPAHVAENLAYRVENGKLIIEIDLAVELRASASGKSALVASTGSTPVELPGGARLSLNVFKPYAKADRKPSRKGASK